MNDLWQVTWRIGPVEHRAWFDSDFEASQHVGALKRRGVTQIVPVIQIQSGVNE
jgi:hypothetical protein